MNAGDPVRESETLAAIRTLLLGTLAIGVLGTSGELVLLRHIDSPTQWIPFAALTAAALTIAWHVSARSARSVRTLQVLMGVFIAAGALGTGLHLDGNVDFEKELHPTEGGFEFVRKVVAGATPVLAPGSLVLLGLVGFAYTHRHPSTTGPRPSGGQESSS